MEVHFTAEPEAQLAQIAAKAGTAPERLVRDAVLRLLEGEAHHSSATLAEPNGDTSLSGKLCSIISRMCRPRNSPAFRETAPARSITISTGIRSAIYDRGFRGHVLLDRLPRPSPVVIYELQFALPWQGRRGRGTLCATHMRATCPIY